MGYFIMKTNNNSTQGTVETWTIVKRRQALRNERRDERDRRTLVVWGVPEEIQNWTLARIGNVVTTECNVIRGNRHTRHPRGEYVFESEAESAEKLAELRDRLKAEHGWRVKKGRTYVERVKGREEREGEGGEGGGNRRRGRGRGRRQPQQGIEQPSNRFAPLMSEESGEVEVCEEEEPTRAPSNSLKIATLNVKALDLRTGQLKPKLIEDLALKYNLDVFGLAEVCASEDTDLSLFQVSGYKVYSNPALIGEKGKNGGVAVLVRESIVCLVRSVVLDDPGAIW